MQEEVVMETKTRTRFIYQTIDKWEDFRNSWKTVRFEDWLNSANDAAICDFWQEQLKLLSEEKEKICILVPLMINKAEKKTEVQEKESQIGNDNLSKKEGEEKKQTIDSETKDSKPNKSGGKNPKKKEGKKWDNSNQVKLDGRVVEIAKRLVDKSFKHCLQYSFESLFYGNEKQLIIYRSCGSINRYLQKYRVPKDFKQKLDAVNILAGEIYEVQRKCNIAISTMAIKIRDSLLEQLQKMKQELSQKWPIFLVWFMPILKDFCQNNKARILCVRSVRYQIYQLFSAAVQKQEFRKDLVVCNCFQQTERDQIRDIEIKKIFQRRENLPEQTASEQANKNVHYIYVDPPKQPELPKDIHSVLPLQMNFDRQSWTWRVHLPKCSKYNQIQGLYLRSPEGEGPSEICLSIEGHEQFVDIEFYPYKVGKCVWDVYVWNEVGFIKSSEKVAFFSQFEIKGVCGPLKNHEVWLVGNSECGIRQDEEVSKLIKLKNQVKEISMYNAAFVCDVQGTCAGWGQMYYTQAQQNQQTHSISEIDQHLQKHLRIEVPCVILQKKYIRKVSCGMGYTLMLNSLGVVWSFGFNCFGQLGQGHLDSNYYTTEPRQVCRFTGESDNFVTDICATSKGSSFALDEKGTLYRWGYNQVEQTYYPIFDRFQTIINYQTGETLYKNATPISVGKRYISGHVKQIQTCEERYYALTKEGDLYGWGLTKLLGCGVLKDSKESEIEDIVNPVDIMGNIDFVSSNKEHTIVRTKGNKMLAWGNAHYFSNKLEGYFDKPVDITAEYLPQNAKAIKQVKAGINYTIVLREDNSMEVIGSETILELGPDDLKESIVEVVCSKYQECFAVLTDP